MKIKTMALTSLALGIAFQANAGEVKYVLWDSNQLPAYEQCAVI